MGSCPCIGMRHGAFLLALCTYCAVRSRAILGGSAEMIARLAFNGNMAAVAVMAVWGLFALLGLWWVVSGYQATRTHADPLRLGSLLWSIGVIALCVHLLQNPMSGNQAGDAAVHELTRAFLVAWLTGNAVNIWLQLRGLFTRRSYYPPLPMPQPAAASSSIFWMRRRRIEEEFYRVERRGGAVHVERIFDLPPSAGGIGRTSAIDHDEPGEAITRMAPAHFPRCNAG